MSKPTMIRDFSGNMVDATNVPSRPARAWRDAWKVDGVVISVDMPAARALFRARASAALDHRRVTHILPLFMDGVLSNDASALASLRANLNASRALATLPAIDAAKDVNALSALWDTHADKLGPNPFA